MPDPNTAGEKDDDNEEDEDDDDGDLLTFPLRSNSQVNRDLNIKKSPENKSKAGDKPASKKGEVRKQSIKIKKSTLQQRATGSKVPSPYNAKGRARQSKQALSLEVERKQTQAEKTDSDPVVRHETGKTNQTCCAW